MTLQEKIAASRAAGATDDEIWQHLQASPQYQQSKAAGIADSDIQQHLGLKLGAPAGASGEATPSGETAPAGAAQPGILSQVGHGAAVGGVAIGKGLVEGSVGLPGTIMGLEQKYLPQSVNDALQNPMLGELVNGPLSLIKNLTGQDVLPTGASLEGHMNDMGLNVTPRNATEEQIDSAGRGMGAAIPTLLLGGAGVLPTLASGAASGEGSYVGQKIAPKGYEDLFSILGGLVGGLGAGAGVVQRVANATTKAGLKSLAGTVDETGSSLNAAQQALDAANAAKQKLTDEAAQMTLTHRQNAFDMDAAHQALIKDTNANAEQQIAAVQEPAKTAITAHADSLGSSDTPQALGENLQAGAKDWMNKLDGKLGDIWSPVDSNVPPGTEVGLPNLKSALDNINTKAGTLEPLNKLLKPALPQAMSDALNQVKAGAEDGIVPPATYADARVLRTTLGKALTDPKLLNSVGESNMKQLYGALTSDLRDSLAPLGLGDAFDSANSASRNLYNFATDHVSKMISNVEGVGNIAPETLASRLTSLGAKGGTMFNALRAQMPDVMDDMASFMVRSGKWSKLAPEAKEGLVPDPQVRASLDANHAALESGAAPIKAATQQQIESSANNVNAVKSAQEQLRLAHQQKVLDQVENIRAHQENLASAKEAHESAKDLMDQLSDATKSKRSGEVDVRSLLKGGLGGYLGDLATTALGIPDPIASGLKMALAGGPLIKYGLNMAKRNPLVLSEAGRGAIVGASNNMALGQ